MFPSPDQCDNHLHLVSSFIISTHFMIDSCAHFWKEKFSNKQNYESCENVHHVNLGVLSLLSNLYFRSANVPRFVLSLFLSILSEYFLPMELNWKMRKPKTKQKVCLHFVLIDTTMKQIQLLRHTEHKFDYVVVDDGSEDIDEKDTKLLLIWLQLIKLRLASISLCTYLLLCLHVYYFISTTFSINWFIVMDRVCHLWMDS